MSNQFTSSIVRILTAKGAVVGAGFLVSQKHVLTCAHVVAQALGLPTETVLMPEGQVKLDFPLLSVERQTSGAITGRVASWQPISGQMERGGDIALLELENDPPYGSQPGRLVNEDDLWAHSFRAFGFPYGYDNGIWASGIIRDWLANGCVQIEDNKETGFFIARGFSGTPVWDDKAAGIVGMIVSAESSSDIRVAYLIPAHILVESCPQIKPYIIPACPYRGLSAFQEQHAPFFFGRENFVRKLLGIVHQKSLIAVTGPSGSGKSSAVFAGLIPLLRQEQKWVIASFQPGKYPFDNLAAKLILLMNPHGDEADAWIKSRELAEMFRQGKNALQNFVERIIEKNHPATSLLLVADQFEEIFTLCRDEKERNHFLTKLVEVGNAASYSSKAVLRVLLTIRADFINHALSYKYFAESLQNEIITLGPMSHRELEEAISKPAYKQKVKIEEGLIERLLESMNKSSGTLPFLEFALTRMWEKQQEGKLTHTIYDEIRGAEKALTTYAETEYKNLPKEEQQKTRSIFIQLIRPGEGTEDTRRPATRAEVGEENWALVTRLANARLLVTDTDKVTGEEIIEMVHEALIKGWERLHRWIEEDRSFRSWQERLRLEMHQWEVHNHDESALLRGFLLAEAENWLKKRSKDLSGPEKTFIKTSKAASKRRQRIITAGISVGLTVVVIFALLAVMGWRRAKKQQNYAESQRRVATARQLTAQAELTRNQHPQLLPLSALLSTEAMRRFQSPSLEADQVLRQALAVLPPRITQIDYDNAVTAAAFSPDGRYLAAASEDGTTRIWDMTLKEKVIKIPHDWPINIIAFSPDGGLLAAASMDNETALLWNAADGREIACLSHDDNLSGVIFSPDGKYAATASWDHTARLWDAGNGHELHRLVHDSKVTGLDFSPDGRYVATSSWDHTARIWDAGNGRELLRLLHKDKVSGLDFSPDGRYVATASWDHTARIWDTGNGEELWRFEHGSKVIGLVVSPDSRYVATLSLDQTVRLWDVAGGREITRINHTQKVNVLFFSPVGQFLATACDDGTARMWDIKNGREIIRMAHNDGVNSVVFSPDGKYLATAGKDGIVGIWEASSICLDNRMVHDDAVTSIIFSPDGKYITTISKDNTAGLWGTDSCRQIDRLRHEWEITEVTFSPQGKYLATAGKDRLVRMWEIASGCEVGRMEHESPVKKVCFSQNGRYLATACEDKAIYLWDMSNGKKIGLTHLEGNLIDLAFSPCGRYLASACDNKATQLWEVKRNREIAQIMPLVHMLQGGIASLCFSPCGKYLAAACRDNTARVWEVKKGREILLLPHQTEISSVAFSPCGRYLATACRDNNISLWELEGGKQIIQLPNQAEIVTVAFSPCGRYLAAACCDNNARLWAVNGGREITRIPHQAEVVSVAFSPCGRYLATACRDKTARLWDRCPRDQAALDSAEPPAEVKEYLPMACLRHQWPITAASFSLSGPHLATAGKDCAVRIWRIWKVAGVHELFCLKQGTGVHSLAFSPDGECMAVAGGDGRVRVYETRNYRLLVQKEHKEGVISLVFSPHGSAIISASGKGRVHIWDRANGRDIACLPDNQGIYDICFSPDGKYLATAHEDQTLQIWEENTWSSLLSIALDSCPEAMALSPDGKYLAAIDNDNTVPVWDLTGKKIATLRHMKKIHTIVFSPGGKYLAAACEDRAAHIWDITGGIEVARLTHMHAVLDIAFDPRGKYVATASSDCTARKWLWKPEDMIRQACERLYRNLTSEEWHEYFGNEPYCKTCENLP